MNNLKYSNGSATYVESLEKKIAELEKQIVAIDMNNEPVAWMYNYENFPDSFVVCRARKSDQDIPLYTHPVKEQDESFDRTASHMAGEYVSHPVKEQDTECQYCKQGCIRCDARKQLTDEEIWHIQAQCHLKNVGYDNFIMRFARAILRKAQE